MTARINAFALPKRQNPPQNLISISRKENPSPRQDVFQVPKPQDPPTETSQTSKRRKRSLSRYSYDFKSYSKPSEWFYSQKVASGSLKAHGEDNSLKKSPGMKEIKNVFQKETKLKRWKRRNLLSEKNSPKFKSNSKQKLETNSKLVFEDDEKFKSRNSFSLFQDLPINKIKRNFSKKEKPNKAFSFLYKDVQSFLQKYSHNKVITSPHKRIWRQGINSATQTKHLTNIPFQHGSFKSPNQRKTILSQNLKKFEEKCATSTKIFKTSTSILDFDTDSSKKVRKKILGKSFNCKNFPKNKELLKHLTHPGIKNSTFPQVPLIALSSKSLRRLSSCRGSLLQQSKPARIRRSPQIDKTRQKKGYVSTNLSSTVSGRSFPHRRRLHYAPELPTDNCDLFESLSSPLTQEQQARLKYLVSKLKKEQGFEARQKVHVVESEVTILVKDINDNPPTFPNTTIYAEVQENGPVGTYVNVQIKPKVICCVLLLASISKSRKF